MKYFLAALVAAILVAGPAFAQSSSSSSSSFSYCYGSACPDELDATEDGYLCTFDSYVGYNHDNGWNAAYWPDWHRRVELRTYERWNHTSNQTDWAIYEIEGDNSQDFHACEREEDGPGRFSNILDCGEYQVNTDELSITHTDASPYLTGEPQAVMLLGIGTCEAR